MSRPKGEGEVKQVATWLPAQLKAELERKAREEKKPAREVMTEALRAHLRGKASGAGR